MERSIDTAITSEAILRTYYTIAGLYTLAASLIWGVNTLFLLDAGLDIFEARSGAIVRRRRVPGSRVGGRCPSQ
jgi:hypothetical protein